MNKKIEEAKAEDVKETAKARYDNLRCKIEENEGILDRKRIELNGLHTHYMHGLVDLTYFAGAASLRERADIERQALHKLVDKITAAQIDYDACVEANEKLIAEAEALKVPLGGLLGSLIGGYNARAFSSALSNLGAKHSETEATTAEKNTAAEDTSVEKLGP